jgi:hypothetical protein
LIGAKQYVSARNRDRESVGDVLEALIGIHPII